MVFFGSYRLGTGEHRRAPGKTELLQAHAQPQSAATTQVTPATRKAKRYLTRKLQREAIERSNWAVWPIDQDWVKKHISLAALLDLPEITWSRSVANWFRADHEGISVFRRSEQPNVGWFVIRKLSPLSTADGRQVVFRRPADALRAAHLHAYDGLKEAVPIGDGLHWQVLPPWHSRMQDTTPAHRCTAG